MADGPGDPRAPGSLVDTASAPSETRRLLTEWAQAVAEAGAPWSATLLEWATASLAEGRFLGRLWVGPKDDAVGLAIGLPAGEIGGRVEVTYLSEGFRGAPSTRAFVARLDAPDGFGPLVEIPDPPRGHDPVAFAEAVRPLGFVPVRRVDMRFPGDRPPPSARPVEGTRLRTMRAEDVEPVSVLTARAYRDNPVDIALFRRHVDPMADARAAISMLVGTALGEWLSSASFVMEDAEGIVGATIVNDHGGPLITEVMVDPRARGQGHATRLLGATVASLRAAGRPEPRLVVTLSNARARRLYGHVGFVEDPTTAGARWLHAERLGLSAADTASA
ncbi:MAG TPA: GNAT family N-acetyltransferase [Thermoplasmata archaeon]|nr:GNAT family N-acetyltransferase [Thermoplasmata archaeon]